jgi:hypothetical protein
VFCPNCGTQNDSAATPCKKCGFKLSGISVPKFKGTMMLNSDQTVQELIEEHRRKQAQGGAAEKKASIPAPKRSPGSSAPPSALSSPRGPVFQPPRAASRGRMGGTMMGVAPQAGGVVPPAVGPTRPAEVPAFPPPVPPSEPARSETAAIEHAEGALPVPAQAGPSPADPLAGTVEVAASTPPPAEDPGREAESLAEESAAEPGPALPAAGTHATSAADRPRPLPAVPIAKDAGNAESGAERRAASPELRAADTEPPRQRAIAATAAMPAQPMVARATAVDSSLPARVRALDVVLIVCTFGLYGLVLLFRQRKRPA